MRNVLRAAGVFPSDVVVILLTPHRYSGNPRCGGVKENTFSISLYSCGFVVCVFGVTLDIYWIVF